MVFYIRIQTKAGAVIVLPVEIIVDKDGPTTGPVPPTTTDCVASDVMLN